MCARMAACCGSGASQAYFPRPDPSGRSGSGFNPFSEAHHRRIRLRRRKTACAQGWRRVVEAELLKLTFHDLTHPGDRDRDSILFQKLITGESAYDAEKRHVRKDGGVLWKRSFSSLLSTT